MQGLEINGFFFVTFGEMIDICPPHADGDGEGGGDGIVRFTVTFYL